MTIFPNRYKKIGWLLAGTGLALLVAWFTLDFRVNLPVLAIVSVYFNTKWFAVFQTNVADELIMVCLVAGFMLVAFSREKEESIQLDRIRGLAMARAALYNGVFLLIAILFFYGQAFIAALLLYMCTWFVMYISIFSYLKKRMYKEDRS
jgi:amino acid transporter